MIVIDEQLKGAGLEEAIGRWYPGSVVTVTALRPNTLIKDEAIPGLLALQKQPIFLTINVTDFWQRLPVSGKYCLVCLTLTTSEIPQIPDLLRRLLRHPDFRAKSKRAGKAVRITPQGNATFYRAENKAIRPLDGF